MPVVLFKKDATMMRVVVEPVPEDMCADLGSVGAPEYVGIG